MDPLGSFFTLTLEDVMSRVLQLDLMVMMLLKGLDRPRTLHKHKCGECEHVFEHMTPPLDATEDDYHVAHNCPKCGHNERDIFEP